MEALEGIRVLNISTVIAGPWAAADILRHDLYARLCRSPTGEPPLCIGRLYRRSKRSHRDALGHVSPGLYEEEASGGGH